MSDYLTFPWKGLSLVLTDDNSFETRVDCVEGSVIISPSETPIQWLEIFSKVNNILNIMFNMYIFFLIFHIYSI